MEIAVLVVALLSSTGCGRKPDKSEISDWFGSVDTLLAYEE